MRDVSLTICQLCCRNPKLPITARMMLVETFEFKVWREQYEMGNSIEIICRKNYDYSSQFTITQTNF